MALRYSEIGDRLKAFRLSSGLSADEIANQIGISRTALYRFEKGELAKIDTLEKLADLLKVSLPTLLGVGIEYVPSAVAYFERMRQIEEAAEHIVVLAGPISFLLASDAFASALGEVLTESVPDDIQNRSHALNEVKKVIEILKERRRIYQLREPTIVNLISAVEIERFLNSGFIGRSSMPEHVLKARRQLARDEIEHFCSILEEDRMGIQVGLVTDVLPHTGFQIFRQPDRRVLTISPFRLGEQPNIRAGVAMITSAPEALALHEKLIKDMWQRAIRGSKAAGYLRKLLAATSEPKSHNSKSLQKTKSR